MTRVTLWVTIFFVLGCPSMPGRLCRADDAAIDFSRDIRPILSDKCYACHGPDEDKREGGFRLDDQDSALGEADSGEFPIVAGDPDSSEVYVRLTIDDEGLRMPPADSQKSVTPEEIQLIRKWIQQGAPWQGHWAFGRPQRPELPPVKNGTLMRSEIDHFILSRLEELSLEPSPEANKTTLIRRVTFDLTGLPPTRQEIDAFLADPSPQAYEKVVDRLLKSPRYGEHMARFWLDAARYGDTHGLHLDNYREMWLYRDWVVRAFNDNMPFDQFTVEQLAGDLLPNPTIDQLVATGFNRCHVTTNEGGSITEEVYVRNVVDCVVTTSAVFMGATFDCTRCHDHKYDPFTMKDFYSLFAFFNNIDGDAMDGNRKDPAPIVRVLSPEQEQEVAALRQQLEQTRAEIGNQLARLTYVEPDPPAEPQPAEPKPTYQSLAAWERDQRAEKKSSLPNDLQTVLTLGADQRSPAQQKQLRDYFLEHAYEKTRATFAPLHAKIEQSEQRITQIEQEAPTTLVFRERKEPRPSFVLNRGEYDQQRDQVQRATPAALPPLPDGAPLNRLGLALWLVDPEHPLTARVTVNRLWQQVFGTGIVKTAEDFGSQGETPSHPKLLDWLAVQFIEDGWDVKAMMKRLVLSATYRQSSHVTPALINADPGNRLLARGPRFRLDAEMLRDQALFVSGLLRETMGGPSVKPPQPDGLWFAVGYSGSNTVRFKQDEGPDKVHRRTLYTFIKRTSPPPQLSTFDAPSREACSMRRERTNTPLQALLLMNDPQFVEAARWLAKRTMREGGDKAQARAAFMFRLCTARQPADSELDELIAVFNDHLSMYRSSAKSADQLAAVDQSTPDGKGEAAELAAWTMVANLMLNLDEVVNKN